MAIFSLNQDQNTGVANNADCLNRVGIEPANFAFVTRDGRPQAPLEYCSVVNPDGTCAKSPNDPDGPDGDDVGCHGPDESLQIRIGGCTGTDNDSRRVLPDNPCRRS
jgi:hypothetical protein